MTDRGLLGRRTLLRGLGAIGTSGLLGGRPRFADAEPPPETTRLRLLKEAGRLCTTPKTRSASTRSACTRRG
jgi:NitT/TauT family transport system substrate-binding protein